MTNYFYFVLSFLLFFTPNLLIGQENDRIETLKKQLEEVSKLSPGLQDTFDYYTADTNLPTFLSAVARGHKVNIIVEPELRDIVLTNNYSNARVIDVIVQICKEHELYIDFTGNILSVKKIPQIIPAYKTREIPISYNPEKDSLTIDLDKDTLSVAFKQITKKTNKNLVYVPEIANEILSGYIKNMPFADAIDKLAFQNDLLITKTRDGIYMFEKNQSNTNSGNNGNENKSKRKIVRKRGSNFFFQVLDKEKQLLEVDFDNASIADIIYQIGQELEIDMYTSSVIDTAVSTSIQAKSISFEVLLKKILENLSFTYRKEDKLFIFGENDQRSLVVTELVPLMHRTIELMNSKSGSTLTSSFQPPQNNFYSNNSNNNRPSSNNRNTNTNRNQSSKKESSTLLDIFPSEFKSKTSDGNSNSGSDNFSVAIDTELNSFIVTGSSQRVDRFKAFIKSIDQPVPLVLIEIVILEVSKTASVETGISWGLGTEPVTTTGSIFPSADVTLGADTVNKIIGGFNGISSWNLGKVVPEFFARIKAMEANGDVKVKSAPKISMLNGHRSNFIIGQTTYYAVTTNNIYGSQIPQNSEITNYYPIDAQFNVGIKPIVSGSGSITLDINVSQSSFTGERIAPEAPPGMNTREFNSIVKANDQDLVILGGLEENTKNDSGTGVPFLSRIPVLKWFFSSRKREDIKRDLTLLIKPTIIN